MALRRAVGELDPDLAQRLDDALAAALQGNAAPIVKACDAVLAMLAGPQRTNERFSARSCTVRHAPQGIRVTSSAVAPATAPPTG